MRNRHRARPLTRFNISRFRDNRIFRSGSLFLDLDHSIALQIRCQEDSPTIFEPTLTAASAEPARNVDAVKRRGWSTGSQGLDGPFQSH